MKRPPLLALLMTVLMATPAAAQNPTQATPPAQATSTTPQAQAASQRARAEQLYREATKLFREQKLEPAVDKYKQALALKQTYDIAGNLGTAELALKRYADAAEHLALCLRIFPVNASAKERAIMQDHLDKARAEVGTLTIVAPEGADIIAGSRAFGRAPLEHDIYVEPGQLTLQARLNGHTPTSRRFQIAAGQTLQVQLPKGELLDDEVVPPKRDYIPEIVLGASGAAALVAGAVLYGLAVVADDSAESSLAGLRTGDNNTPCDLATNQGTCTTIANDLDRAYALSGAGIALFALGGAALAAGAVHFAVVDSGDQPSTTSLTVTPTIGALNGVQISGTF